MAVILPNDRTFAWPVYIYWPNGGDWDIQTFTAYFTEVERDELKDIREGNLTDEQVLRAHLKGWEGVTDDEGNPLPCEGETLEAALNRQPVVDALIEALTTASDGQTARKNSKKPRAN